MTLNEAVLQWPEHEPGRDVELRIPADPAYIRLARLVGSGLATSCDFDIEALDDLTVSISEACSTLIEVGDGSALDVRFGMFGGWGVWLDAVTPVTADPVLDETRYALTERMLNVICDQHEFTMSLGIARFRLIRLAEPNIAEVDGDSRRR